MGQKQQSSADPRPDTKKKRRVAFSNIGNFSYSSSFLLLFTQFRFFISLIYSFSPPFVAHRNMFRFLFLSIGVAQILVFQLKTVSKSI